MKVADLFEMPQIIDSIDWLELNDVESNKKKFSLFSSKKYKKKVLRLNEYAVIFQNRNEFFCLDASIGRVTYYMSYQTDRNKVLDNYVWQSLVWRYDLLADDYLKDIPKKIFWNNLFPKFETIITDSEQTWEGRSFWKLRIAEALKKNLNVYFYDFANYNLQQLFHFDELHEFQIKYNIWDKQELSLLKRMVITSKSLSK